MQVMSNLLYYYGMCGVVKELLLKRYFSKVLSQFSCTNTIKFLVNIFLHLYNTQKNDMVLHMLLQEVRGNAQVPESDIVQECRRVSNIFSSPLFFFATLLTFLEIKIYMLCSLYYTVALRAAEYKCMEIP